MGSHHRHVAEHAFEHARGVRAAEVPAVTNAMLTHSWPSHIISSINTWSRPISASVKAGPAFTDALLTVSSVLQNIAGQAPAGADRDRIVENWLRIARMSKDGVVGAIERMR
jgi:hypothetical protein